jgi:sulfatase maturation enzyme AslB (radical SAM superfamily)
VSLVGGDPLVRYREVDSLLPEIERRGVFTQIVTSAFRPIPSAWMAFENLNVVVSIDGLQPEHDARRKPATYDRILKNIEGARITVHCTITAQMADRPGYLDQFLVFWSSRPEVERVWFSLFTPQRGATDAEILSDSQRAAVIDDLLQLRRAYPVLEMPEALIRELQSPPRNPQECLFARTTKVISADLRTAIVPCQFGGDPDCGRCGCIASMALAAVGHHSVLGGLTAGRLFAASDVLGRTWRRLNRTFSSRSRQPVSSPFRILHP